MSLKIGCDVDGVLTNFEAAYQGVARRLFARPVDEMSPEDACRGDVPTRDAARVWEEIGTSENWWTRLAAIEPFQIERLYRLARELRWEVFFLTNRPASVGDTAQFQTEWWLESHGFYLPCVLSVAGSRAEAARALKLDVVFDDRLDQCIEVASGATAKTIFIQRRPNAAWRDEAIARGIGVVSSLEQALDVTERIDTLTGWRHPGSRMLPDWPRRPDDEAEPADRSDDDGLPDPTPAPFEVPDLDLDGSLGTRGRHG